MKHDWGTIDPQLQAWAEEGANPVEMCRRLGWDAKKRQTLVDRLRKMGLGQSSRRADAMAIEAPGDQGSTDEMSPIGDTVTVSEVVDPLSPTEVQTLEHYERIIAQGFKTFVEVGQALLAIRDQRLYRQTFPTFEAYVQERWDLSRPHAYRMIDAAVVVEHVAGTSDTVPENEAQARPLASLPAEEQAAAWQDALKSAPKGKVTAAHVQDAVNRRTRRTQEPPTRTVHAVQGGAQEAPQHAPRSQPQGTQARRLRVQDALVRLLESVDDAHAWPILQEVAGCLQELADTPETPAPLADALNTGVASVWKDFPAPPKRRQRLSREARWQDAVETLQQLQEEYEAWLDGMPENLQASQTAEMLREITMLDLSELEDVEHPKGFGRD
jgi:hypothetical protein